MVINFQAYTALEPIVEHSTPDMTFVEILEPNECLTCAITRNGKSQTMGSGFISNRNEQSPKFFSFSIDSEISNTPLKVQAYSKLPTIFEHCVSDFKVVEYTTPIKCFACATERNHVQQTNFLENVNSLRNTGNTQNTSVALQNESENEDQAKLFFKRLFVVILVVVMYLFFLIFACI